MKYKLVANAQDTNLDEVIEWLYQLDPSAEIDRVSSNTLVRSLGETFTYAFSEESLKKENDCVWWVYKSTYAQTKSDRIQPTDYAGRQQIGWYLDKEKEVFLDYYYQYRRDRFLGYTGDKEINKLKVLAATQKIGIKIPATLITTSKTKLLEFYHAQEGNIINKAIGNCFSLSVSGGRLMNYTEKISLAFIETLPDTFGLSLFQQAIEKEFEVRSFLLGQDLHSMAIFSQRNAQTQTDFRVYDQQTPNRTRSMRLPTEIEDKLLELAGLFQLDTGSFDLLVNRKGDFYFLEVNPSGQFGMVSKPCNYYLEREIARYLINLGQKNG